MRTAVHLHGWSNRGLSISRGYTYPTKPSNGIQCWHAIRFFCFILSFRQHHRCWTRCSHHHSTRGSREQGVYSRVLSVLPLYLRAIAVCRNLAVHCVHRDIDLLHLHFLGFSSSSIDNCCCWDVDYLLECVLEGFDHVQEPQIHCTKFSTFEMEITCLPTGARWF